MIVQPVDDGIRVEMEEELVGFLLQFPRLLATLDRTSDDPAARRLHVPVYLDDPEANGEWWGFMGDELARSRQADRSALVEALTAAVEGTVVSREEAHAIVRVLVEARLVLAARLGIEVESDYERLDEREAAMVQALGELQMAFLWALRP